VDPVDRTLPDSPAEIAFSLGDPHGIGPEVLLRALCRLSETDSFRGIIFGPEQYLLRLAETLGLQPDFHRHRIIPQPEYAFPPPWGEVSPRAGRAAWDSLEAAVEYCRDVLASGRRPLLVTPPVHKAALQAAGFPFPGQTEFLASAFPGSEATMAFFSHRFHIILVTTHLGLREVFDHLSPDLIVQRTRLFHRTLAGLLGRPPRIALAGLNPHASEGGRFGDEEARILEPALRRLAAEGCAGVSGPWPPDSVFRQADQGEFDGVVALYHDQGLIPLKLVAFHTAVNTTLGLPVFRTSPDHGTAFDIAGRGTADSRSMEAAIQWGLRLCRAGGHA
jgi:4-hydroxythreonine-4-phosphate dehydrogenase